MTRETLGRVSLTEGRVDERPQEHLADQRELATLRADVDALSDELLNRYEEVTLLYELSRELGVALDVEAASQIALLRTLQVVPAHWGQVVVGSQTDDLAVIASAGSTRRSSSPCSPSVLPGQQCGRGTAASLSFCATRGGPRSPSHTATVPLIFKAGRRSLPTRAVGPLPDRRRQCVKLVSVKALDS